MVVHTAVAVLAAVLAIVAVIVLFDVVAPQQPLLFALSFVLAAASVFSLGLLVGALVRSTSSGAAVGMGIYFPMLFFAGVWIPRSVMPDGLRTVSDFTPLGAAVQAMNDSWLEGAVSLQPLLVMAAYALVVGFIAMRVFRWD
jgi:ABC-2 type transport system permease protein